MTKKYYGYFIYRDKAYVIRFKICGSLELKRDGCGSYYFEDKDWYVRSIRNIIALAAGPFENDISSACLLTHDLFVEYRAAGVKRWDHPYLETIKWD